MANDAKWVTLHMVAPRRNEYPSEATGILLHEDGEHYTLGAMLVEDAAGNQQFSEGFNLINKTFVYRVEVLLEQPALGQGFLNEGGGLG